MQLDSAIVRAETARLWQSLPELTSLTQPELKPGTTLTNRSALAALQFVAAYNATPMRSLFPVTSVAVTGPETFELRGPSGRSVEILDRDFERQLARWESLHRYTESKGVAYEWAGISHTNNIPVRPVSSTPEPPARHP
jgi:hypothetical protein